VPYPAVLRWIDGINISCPHRRIKKRHLRRCTGGTFLLDGSSGMTDIWEAARDGDVGEVEWLVGHDAGLLDARDGLGRTPLMLASEEGHVGVVRWLLDNGAAMNETYFLGWTALFLACTSNRPPIVRLLVGRGADPAIATAAGRTPLLEASIGGHLEVVRLLLGHPSARATINHRNDDGETALWKACELGRGGVARALLENGADPTIADDNGTTAMAIAKQEPNDSDISAEGRRECVVALEVRSWVPSPPSTSTCFVEQLTEVILCLLSWAWLQEAERAYLLWKARQVADQQGSGAVAVPRGEEEEALVDYAVHGLKGDLFPELMDYMAVGGGAVCVGAVPKPGVDATGRGLGAVGAVPAVEPAAPASPPPVQGRGGWMETCRIM
jgi:hypothetical protein